MQKIRPLILLGAIIVLALIAGLFFAGQQKIDQRPPYGTTSTSEIVDFPHSPDGLNYKTYRNEEWEFEFNYPSSWIIKDDGSRNSSSAFTRMGAPADQEYLIYYPSPPLVMNIVSSNFVEKQFSDLKDISSDVIIDGVRGVKYVYRGDPETHITIILPIKQHQMILGTTRAYEDVFNQILSSFKFLDTK
jgi:hypothetical protein